MKKYLLLFLTFGLPSCSDENINLSAATYPITIDFRPLLCPEQGGTTAIETASQTVISDENNYLHHIEVSDLSYDGDIPSVDFQNETVIAVNMGQQGSSGHHIEITAITEFETSILVEFESITPSMLDDSGNPCTRNSIRTSPFCIVSIPSNEKDIIFEETAIEACI